MKEILKRAVHMANVMRNSDLNVRNSEDFVTVNFVRPHANYHHHPEEKIHVCEVGQKIGDIGMQFREPQSMNRTHVSCESMSENESTEACAVELIARLLVEHEKDQNEISHLNTELAQEREKVEKVEEKWKHRYRETVIYLRNQATANMGDFIVRFAQVKQEYITIKFVMREVRKIDAKHRLEYYQYNTDKPQEDLKKYFDDEVE